MCSVLDLTRMADGQFVLRSVDASVLLKRRNMTANVITDGMNGIMNTDHASITSGERDRRAQDSEDSSRDGLPYQSQNSKSSESSSGSPISEEQNARLAALVEQYGYQLIKENGQRKFCAPPEWGLSTPPRGSEVFIGKLPRDIYEYDLVPLFERCGKIYEMRLMMDFSGTNRGFAFVTYTNREDAQRACMELNNYEIRRGRHIGVVLSVDNCRLFVGGIPRNRTRDEVKDEMVKLTEGVVRVILYPSAADKTKNRGFAFVEYKSHLAAAQARRKLLPNRIQLWGSVIAVDWAEPEPEVDEATMAKVKILYVRNLMMHTTEDTLRLVFERAAGTDGCVERVKKMRDYAFIQFATREQASIARDELDGSNLEGSNIEVLWSKPPTQSNLVRCMKNLQKSGGRGFRNGTDDYIAATMRQVCGGSASTFVNGILACPTGTVASPSTPIVDPNAVQPPFTIGQTPAAAALTGYPCIDPYANVPQAYLDRQVSAAGQIGNPSAKFAYGGSPNFQAPANGNAGVRVTRGAAGMRSAGFQAMLNNSLRHTNASRRKFSEQFLYDYLLSQQQQQLLAQQQASDGLVIIPNGHGLSFWRPTVTSPTSGFVPLFPSAPFTVPMPQTTPASVQAPGSAPVVSEAAVGPVAVAVPVSAPAPITTVSNSDESSSPAIQQMQQSQQVAQSTLLPAPQLIFSGNSAPVQFTSYQQHLEDLCRDHGFGAPQYEQITMQHKDVNGRDVLLYNCKITIPSLANTHGTFHVAKVWTSETEAREAAAQFVCAQLGAILTNPPSFAPGFDVFGIPQMAPMSPWIMPDMVNQFVSMNPLYQQQLRRPVNQQLSVNAGVSPPLAVV